MAAIETAAAVDRCVFVGDSESDMVSARAAGTKAIGYANKPGKATRLMAAGANVVLTDAFPDDIL